MGKPIKLGVFGGSRGMSFGQNGVNLGMEVVAVCDNWEERANNAAGAFGATAYTDFDKFLEHDFDALILANFFHQHAPYAIKALDAGRHVISECIACKTLGEGVELARAVERSGKIYFFAENYAYFTYCQEMRRLYQAGEIGEFQYAEGEYNHPIDAHGCNQLSPGYNHWRNWIPPTYYSTHAMSPLMYATDTRPISLNSQSITVAEGDTRRKMTARHSDLGFCTMIRMDNGGLVRLMGLGLAGHSIWYRIHGTRGLMENLRTGDQNQLRIVHESWDIEGDEVPERIYSPEVPVAPDLVAKAGHGGGDFFTMYYFKEAIERGEQPWMNVYRGLDMTFVGIQAWRSCLANGAPVEVPDFSKEEVRVQYEGDNWSPMPEDAGPGQPFSSIKGKLDPTPEGLAYARQVWDEMGYKGE